MVRSAGSDNATLCSAPALVGSAVAGSARMHVPVIGSTCAVTKRVSTSANGRARRAGASARENVAGEQCETQLAWKSLQLLRNPSDVPSHGRATQCARIALESLGNARTC